ncbi:hypothetical protein, partial [Streptomyces swartbergensis]
MDAPEARTESATPGRPSPRGARYGHRRRAVSSEPLVVHSDAQAAAGFGGCSRHRSEGLREFLPGVAKGLGEG